LISIRVAITVCTLIRESDFGLLAADKPVLSALTSEALGWQLTHPGLVDDLDKGHYSNSWSAWSAEPKRHHGGTQ
jgi:hypothetical protein